MIDQNTIKPNPAKRYDLSNVDMEAVKRRREAEDRLREREQKEELLPWEGGRGD